MKKSEAVYNYLLDHYPNAKCSLTFNDDYQCLVAIILSAQTTDRSVNKVTPNLFKHFPNPSSLGKATVVKIEDDIRSLGLYHSKAISLQKLGNFIVFNCNNIIPKREDILLKIPGVGKKTARVFLLERGDDIFLPVDTHIKRIAIRLNYAPKNDDVTKIELKLEKSFPKDTWKFLHHSLIEFGRNECKAINPLCRQCGLNTYCSFFKKNSLTIDK